METVRTWVPKRSALRWRFEVNIQEVYEGVPLQSTPEKGKGRKKQDQERWWAAMPSQQEPQSALNRDLNLRRTSECSWLGQGTIYSPCLVGIGHRPSWEGGMILNPSNRNSHTPTSPTLIYTFTFHYYLLSQGWCRKLCKEKNKKYMLIGDIKEKKEKKNTNLKVRKPP